MNFNPTFQGPYDHAIFARPMPRGVRTGNGLQWTGGVGGECLSLFDPKERYEHQVAEQSRVPGDFKGCWFPSAIDSTHVKLTGGSFTCGSIFTPSVSSIAVDASALNYIYLRASLSPAYVDGYVDGGSATAAVVMSGSSIPTSDNTYGYILLCSWQASALVDRYEFFSLKARLSNSGSGNVRFEPGMS